MAEVIGIVSGALTFATVVAQVTKSIIEIKDCWDQVRDAPEDLQQLIREVEIFGLILADIEKDLSQDSVASILQRNNHALQSLELCREASVDLKAVSEGLMSDVRINARGFKRSYASLKFIIKKSNIEKYKTRLGSATRLLSLSQQCYTRALIQAQPDLIVARIQMNGSFDAQEVSLDGPQNTKIEDGNNTDATRKITQNSITRRSPRTDYLWRLMMPSWMTSKCLEVAHSGWQWHLRTYNIVANDSMVLILAYRGDIGALQQIFSSGKASPFDVTDDGITLIAFACAGRCYETVKFLIAQGAEVDTSDFRLGRSPLSLLCISRPSGSNKAASIMPLLRFLSKYNFDYLDGQPEDLLHSLIYNFSGTAEEFVYLQQNYFPSFNDLEASEPKRVRLAKGFLRTYLPHSVSEELLKILRILLRGISFADCPSKFKTYSDFLESKDLLDFPSLIAEQLGYRQGIEQFYGYPSGYESMFCLFNEFLVGGYDITNFQIDHWFFTPLGSFCRGYLSKIRKQSIDATVNSGLRLWLRDLQKSGVNLGNLGRKADKNFKKSYLRGELGGQYSRETAFYMIGFSHGPTPEDWKLWISEPSDAFAGEFWEMIERRMEMPGGWSDVHLFL